MPLLKVSDGVSLVSFIFQVIFIVEFIIVVLRHIVNHWVSAS